MNDSTIDTNHKKDIFNRFGKIDMMACQFSGASWWPLCYDNYSKKEMKKLCDNFIKRKITDYFKLIDRLEVVKTLTTAGPPCFLDKKLVHLNYYNNNISVFPDCWDIPEFDNRDDIFRVKTGTKFTYNNITDIKKRPFDKDEFINSRIYEDNETITEDEFIIAKNKFISWMGKILKSSLWLKKYIFGKIFLSVNNHEVFCLNFRNGEIQIMDNIDRKGMYYIIKIPGKIFYKLVMNDYTDWETAFLSMKIRFERHPDKYNPWILSFFRNLNIKQLDMIKEVYDSHEIDDEKIRVGKYEINRYCPHQNYDLLYHSKINLEEKTIQCLGHGWEWCIKSGVGKNCSVNLESKKIETI